MTLFTRATIVAQRAWDHLTQRPSHEWETAFAAADQLAEREAQEDVSEPRYCNQLLLSGLYCGLRSGHDRWHQGAAGGPFAHSTSAMVPAEPADSEEGVSVNSPTPPSSRFNFADWATPAIVTVLREHRVVNNKVIDDAVYCCDSDGAIHTEFGTTWEWEEHVAPLVARHLEQTMEQRA